jgi:hypothetical protein
MIDHGTTLPKDTLSLVAWSNGSRMSRQAAARAWVDAARGAGLYPRIVQQSLSSGDAGEWHIATCEVDHGLPGRPGPVPDELWDEVFLILEATGDIVHDTELKCWHGAVLLDETGRRAVALRLRLARCSLDLSAASFYEPIQLAVFPTLCERAFSEEDLRKLCEYYGIPEGWLTSGEPAEIELPVKG